MVPELGPIRVFAMFQNADPSGEGFSRPKPVQRRHGPTDWLQISYPSTRGYLSTDPRARIRWTRFWPGGTLWTKTPLFQLSLHFFTQKEAEYRKINPHISSLLFDELHDEKKIGAIRPLLGTTCTCFGHFRGTIRMSSDILVNRPYAGVQFQQWPANVGGQPSHGFH